MMNNFLSYLVALNVLAGTLKRPTLTQGAQDFQQKGEMMTFLRYLQIKLDYMVMRLFLAFIH